MGVVVGPVPNTAPRGGGDTPPPQAVCANGQAATDPLTRGFGREAGTCGGGVVKARGWGHAGRSVQGVRICSEASRDPQALEGGDKPHGDS